MRTPITSLFALIVALAVAPAAGAPTVNVVVPGGFRVTTFASGLQHPTAMAWGPDGRLYVTQDTGNVVVDAKWLAEAGRRRARAPDAARARVARRGSLRLRAGTALAVHAPGLVARRPANRRARPPVRSASAGQRRRRARWSALSRERLDLRRVSREGSPERDGALAAAGRERPPRRCPGAAEPLWPRVPARHRPALRLGERTGRDRHEGSSRAGGEPRRRPARAPSTDGRAAGRAIAFGSSRAGAAA